MLSIVDRRPIETPLPVIAEAEEVHIDEIQPEPEEAADFEIVMGRLQIAGVLFVATVIVVAFSAVSYLAGRSAGPNAPAPVAAPAPAIVEPPPAVSKPEKPAEPVVLSTPPATIEKPLFADPKRGVLYLQLGAVEKGIAVIMAEGLRKRGFDSFVAPGPNDHVFRVLVGPLDAEGYKRAKDGIDRLALSTFARKYQE
jgi:cell division septation protein DedD